MDILLNSDSTVVDVGAGLGGPARYLASTFGCSVNAIEYLEKSVRVGHVINLLTQCHDKVHFYNNDVTKITFEEFPQLLEAHDLLVSQLAILHIADKGHLFPRLAKFLKPGGAFFIEDFFHLDGGDFNEEEKKILEKDINVPDGKLNTKEEYIEDLEKNGLEVETWRDDTREWSEFVWNRYEKFLADSETLRAKNGEAYIRDMGHFYKQMAVLYHGDAALRSRFPLAQANIPEDQVIGEPRLGGVTIIGKRKQQ